MMSALEPAFLAVVIAIAVLFCAMLALLAAVMFLHGRNESAGRKWTGLERAWEGPMLSCLAGDAVPEALWEKVPPGEGLFFLQYLWRYHKTLLGAERRMVERMAQPYLGLLPPRLADRRPEIRARAAVTLGALGGEAHVQLLKTALNDPSDLVAMQAAWALARRGDPATLPDILTRLARYRFWDSGFLVSMLSSMGGQAAPVVRGIFRDASRPAAERALAASVLRKLRDYASADVALSICRAPADPRLLAASLELLGEVGGADAAKAAEPHCLSADPGVRTQALRTLGRLGGEAAWLVLLAAMGDGAPGMRLEAASALYRSGGRKILAEISISKDPRARAALQILEQGGRE